MDWRGTRRGSFYYVVHSRGELAAGVDSLASGTFEESASR